jgi:hypothetical protein
MVEAPHVSLLLSMRSDAHEADREAHTDTIGRSAEEYDLTFNDDEIERERRKATKRHKNVDEAKLQAAKDMLLAARTEEPEIFEARLRSQGIEPNSERGRQAMGAYWIIRRGKQH